MFLNFFLFHWEVSIALAFPVISGVWHFWMPVFVAEAEVMCCLPCPLSPGLLPPLAVWSLAAAGAILFWRDATFVLKSGCGFFFFNFWYFHLLASVEAMSEFQVLGVVADSCTSWCIRNWVALCIPSISEQLNKGYGWFLGVFDSCFALSPSFLFVPP